MFSTKEIEKRVAVWNSRERQAPLLGPEWEVRLRLEEQLFNALRNNETQPNGELFWSTYNGHYTDYITDGTTRHVHIDQQVRHRLLQQDSVTVLDPFAGLGITLNLLAQEYSHEVAEGRLKLVAVNAGIDIKAVLAGQVNIYTPLQENLAMITDNLANERISYFTGHILTAIDKLGLIGNVDIVTERLGICHSAIPDFLLYLLTNALKSDGLLYLGTNRTSKFNESKEGFGETEFLFQCRRQAFEMGIGNVLIGNRQALIDGRHCTVISTEASNLAEYAVGD